MAGAWLRIGRRGLRARARLSALALLLSWVAVGCRERAGQITIPPLPAERDAAVEAGLPDGAMPCADDGDCDDGVDCTRDLCVRGGYCVNAASSSRCDDGVFCNGQEVCDPVAGCRSGGARRCHDEDPCTIDYCDEEAKRCVHGPRDFDDDGEVDWHCLGGTDCDDFDATRAGALSEVCGDGVDNDCDSRIDESDGCRRAAYDRCDDALDVTGGGRFEIDLLGAGNDYALGCGELGPRDVTFTFTLDEPRDVTLRAIGLLGDVGTETATLALRGTCEDIATELECNYGFPGQVRRRALPAGRYFAIINSEHATRAVLEARFDEPTEPPTNISCEAPLDLGDGGRFEGDFVEVGDDVDVPCSFSGATDLTYTFTIEEERDVEISAISLTDDVRMSVAVRSACDDPATEVRCFSNAPARGRLHQLPAGTYYVIVEGSSAREVDFSLDVAFLDPTPPPPGDSCAEPLELALEDAQTGSLANRQDLVEVARCDCQPSSDEPCNTWQTEVVYRLVVPEPTDLAIDLGSTTAVMSFDLRSVCESASARLACGTGGTLASRVRNLAPGEYFLVIEALQSAGFRLEVSPLPLTVPVPVGGNDTCATAIEIPPEGGLFSGDTLGFANHYEALCGNGAQSSDAAFRLTLTARSRVVASLEAPFDTVLHRYRDDGQGAAACNSATGVCNDDGGFGNRNSRLDEMLDPGTYYYVVDGFGGNNQGTYLLDVAVSEP